MQISNAASSAPLTQTAQTGIGATSNATPSSSGTAAASTSPVSPDQDAAVSISSEGTAELAAGQGSMPASSTMTQTGTASSGTTTSTDPDPDTTQADDTNSTSESGIADDAANDGSASGDTTSVSPLKSFAYGSLGLERPDQTKQETNTFYTAGRWLAAGITIGGLISLFV